MKSILVLGSEGFIGSYLVPRLRAHYAVTTVDIGWFSDTTPDISCDYGALWGEELRGYDVIIVLAGYSSVPMCTSMYRTFQNNVFKFVSLLDRLPGDPKAIYMSSGSVANGLIDMTEDMNPQMPINHYDTSKLTIDMYAKSSGKNYYGLRLGTVCYYSPNQRLDLLYQKMAWSAVRKGKVELTNRYSLRSVLTLPDLCRAVMAIIDGPDAPGIYNVASFDTTMVEAANQVVDYYGGEVVNLGDTPGGYSFTINCGKIRDVFGVELKGTPKDIFKTLSKGYLESISNIEQYSRVINERVR